MKLYLAGMGTDDASLLELADNIDKPFRRLITFAYKSEAKKILNLKRKESNEKERTFKRVRKSKSGNSV